MKDLKLIAKQEQDYRALKRTSVLLMPRWQKFRCANKEDLIRALQIEKVWERFNDDMEAVRMAEKELNESYTKEEFIDNILTIAVRDFKVGNEREELVVKWLEERNWEVKPYSDKAAYSNETKGIDIVCTHPEKETRYIQVKSGGFWFAPIKYQLKQLKKMATNDCFLIVVDQNKGNKLTITDPNEIKEIYNFLKGGE